MKVANFSVKKPVTILMIVLIVMLLGSVSLSKLAIDLFPEIEVPILAVITEYEGVGPEEVESVVTRNYEQQLSTIAGVDTVMSESSAGQSVIMISFNWGTNLDEATNQIREKLEFVQPFMPDNVGKSMVMKMDMNAMPIIMMGVSGDRHLDDIKTIVDDKIVPRLERTEGVAAVTTSGGNVKEIHVEVDPLKLQAYGLTIDDVSNVIRSENNNASGGYIQQGSQDYLVRITGEYQSMDELMKTVIPLRNGGTVRLTEIGSIKETYKDSSAYAILNGKPAIALAIQKQSDGNTVQVSSAVKKAVEELDAELMDDIDITYAMDQADFIRFAIDSVLQNGYVGAALAVLILLIFLRSIRSTMVVGTAIPISVIATFIMVYFSGLTLNMMSLGGLALGIGMMVDNAIVVLENIYRHRQMGKSKVQAAIDGANEVSKAVVASTLTTVAVFVPIVFVEGLSSQIFRPLALTVTFSLVASLLVALTFVPMLSSKILIVANTSDDNRKGFTKRVDRTVDGALGRIDLGYSKVVSWALRHKKMVILLVGLAIIGSGMLVPTIGMEFIPGQDSGAFNVKVELPPSTVISETDQLVDRVVKVFEDIPEMQTYIVQVGNAGGMSMTTSSNVASFSATLVPLAERERSTDEIMQAVREELDSVAGAKVTVYSQDMAMGSSDPIAIKLKGPDLDMLEEVSGQMVAAISAIDGINNAKSSIADTNPELSVKVNREKAAFYGINSYQVSQSIWGALQGNVVSKYKVDGQELDIRIIIPEKNRKSIEDLNRLMIPSMSGGQVPLEEVATISFAEGPSTISRENQSRVVTVTAGIFGRDLGSVTKDVQAKLDEMPLPVGYQIEFGGSSAEMMEAFSDLALALVMAILLVYMILASQLEGLLYPFVIMFSLPPTFIGVVITLALTGHTLSVISFIGLIMLAGIVVNNAIVLVDYINTLRERGISKTEAIVEAGRTRLRPILMTTLTTVLALLPQMFSTAEGAELSAPLAAVVVGGLTFSTIITLVLVPVMYSLLDSMGTKVMGKISRRERRLEQGSE